MEDEHIIEGIGKAQIKIQNGKVSEVSEPKIEYCPLFHKHRNMEIINKEAIKENMEFRIEDFGMCTPDRQIKMKDFLTFGISEISSTLLEEKVIDCVIMVCEGCGTLIVTDPEVAQGVGGRVSGLVKTCPIPEIICKIGETKILDPRTARINQVDGLKLAIKEGYKKIAITVTKGDDCLEIKKIKESNPNVEIYLFGVHTTAITRKDARILFDNCEILTACASKYIWEIGEKEAVFKVGESIPIYATNEKGKEFLEIRLEKIGGKTKKENAPIPKPLV